MKYLFLLLLLSTSQLSFAQQFSAPEAEGEGVIHNLDFGSSSLTLQGQTYRVSPSAEVEINGSYGAFTMLEVGMRVAIVFRRHSDGMREIVELRELRDDEELEVL